MTTVIRHNDTIDATDMSYAILGHCVHHVTFLHGGGDDITVKADHLKLDLNFTFAATVHDEAQGLNLRLDPFSLMTTITGLQNDHCAVIDLFKSPFQDNADLAAHLQVTPFGTVLNAAVHGPQVAFFAGDYNVDPSQFRIHH